MSVRRLKAKQRGPFCTYCQERAVWRGSMFRKFACNAHEHWLRDDDRRDCADDYSDAAFMAGY